MTPSLTAIRQQRTARLLALVCMGGLATAQATPTAAPAGLDIGVSIDYANGSLRDLSASKALSTTLVTRYNLPYWQFGVDIPYLVLNETPPNAAQGGDVKVRGFGDVALKMRRTLVQQASPMRGLDLTLKVKTASANAQRGLGTGGTDVALQLEAYRAHRDWLLFGHLGKRHTGKSAVLPRASHPLYTEVGLQKAVSPACGVGAFHTFRQANGRSGRLSEATVYTQTRLDKDIVQLSLTKGFTPSSPRWSAGLAYTLRF